MACHDNFQHADFQVDNLELQLLPGRGVYWPRHESLFVADTHFGKEASFRKAGIPMPRGSTEATLHGISHMLSETNASHLVILGDMFHMRSSLSHDVVASINGFFAANQNLLVTLVRGNHDAHVGSLPSNWPIDTIEPGKTIDGIALAHFPNEFPEDAKLLLCGHVHPSVQVCTPTEKIGRLPCFYLNERRLILPAIGHSTGTHPISPKKEDRIWITLENKVLEYKNWRSNRLKSPSTMST